MNDLLAITERGQQKKEYLQSLPEQTRTITVPSLERLYLYLEEHICLVLRSYLVLRLRYRACA